MLRGLVGRQVRLLSAAKASKAGDPKKKVRESKFGSTTTVGGTGLKTGEKIPIAILKDAPDPIAKSDDQYPDWLWTQVLDLPTLEECRVKCDEAIAQGLLPPLFYSQRYETLKRRVSVGDTWVTGD